MYSQGGQGFQGTYGKQTKQGFQGSQGKIKMSRPNCLNKRIKKEMYYEKQNEKH